MTNLKMMRACLSAGAFLVATPAGASGVNGTMPVSAITVNSCAVIAAPLVFGTLNQLGGVATDSQTNVTVTCTPGVQFEVGMDMGAHASGGVRQMRSALGGNVIPYRLYSNVARTAAWGNTPGANTVTGSAGLTPVSLNVYGRVAGDAALVPADVYSDLVTVTVTF